MLLTQSSTELDLWQTRHENADKSSKVVPLAAPLPRVVAFNSYPGTLQLVSNSVFLVPD